MNHIKVASYCRVSTDHNDQVNSFASQQQYFREYIGKHPDWELYEIYADEGVSGTSTKKRVQFNRMIDDAYGGKFRLILTKEVSRFSRNILDTISYTRQLRSIGVGVLFLTDRINTLEPEAEMLLSFLSSLAQEESRRTSTRVVWGQTRQMEKGIVFGQSLLGYDVKGGCLTINPQGSEIVRLIFQKYVMEQIGTSAIARFLTKEGYRTYSGSTKWNSNSVVRILKNEKYVGDLVQKKSYTPDFLTHEKRQNTGQVPLIIIPNHHEPIVSREVWNLAQERLFHNDKHRISETGHSNRYIFSGKIRCGECGSAFVGRFRYLKDGRKLRRWSCATATKEGSTACDVGKLVRDDDALLMLKSAIGNLCMDRSTIISNVTALAMNAIRVSETMVRDDPERLHLEIAKIRKKKNSLLDSFLSQEISKEDMLSMKQHYENKIDALFDRLDRVQESQMQGKDTASIENDIRCVICAVISCEITSEVFCKQVLESLTVFKDRHMQLKLHKLSHVFWFAE